MSVTCPNCNKNFSRKFTLKRHIERNCRASKRSKIDDDPELSKIIHCDKCNSRVPAYAFSAHLKSERHKAHAWVPDQQGIEISRSSFGKRIVSYKLTTPISRLSVEEFMEDLRKKYLEVLEVELVKHKLLKINLNLFGLYLLPSQNITDIKSHNSKNKVVDVSTDLETSYSQFISFIENQASEFLDRDSGWILIRFLYLEININKFNPTRASAYIQLPKEIARKHCILNPKNNDQCCFAWALTAAVCTANGPVTEVSSYPHFSTCFDYSEVEFPMSLKAIENFELKNNISINVYGLEEVFLTNRKQWQVVGPLHFTKKRKPQHINLLLIDDSMGNYHYCLIQDLSKLISQQISHHNGVKYFCQGCLTYFTTREKLYMHEQNECDHVRAILPTKEPYYDEFGNYVRPDIVKFTNYQKQLRQPFCIYADFECILEPVDGTLKEELHTERKYKHIPCSFAYYIKSSIDNSISKVEFYRGSDAAKVFIARLEADCIRIYNEYLKKLTPMKPLTPEEEEEYKNSTFCYLCEEPFGTELGKTKVRDHCHITGFYRQPLHMSCNINYKTPLFIPVVFHNLRNYDSHLFIRELGADKEPIDIIPLNYEKYISFSKSINVDKFKCHDGSVKSVNLNIRFIDSFQFLPESLDHLADTLEESQFREVRRYFPQEDRFNLMRRKGVFPYSYIDCIEKLEESKLPDISKFYNELKGEDITPEEYARASNIFEVFGCNTLGDYYDLYLLTDVLLLADIFENYRDICKKYYNLDPAHYYTSPGLSWDAMLKYTKVELELLKDIEMIHFFKESIRGGISMCVSRKAEANNKFLPNYDPTKPTSYIMYLDATNLYGYAMEQELPSGEFNWLTDSEIEKMYTDIETIPNTSQIGYVLEVDLIYSQDKHLEHNELPFACENALPPSSKLPKLIPNLQDKEKYTIHYTALQQCLKYGLKLKKIHRGLKFKQSCWLKPYIELNTKLRNAAKNKFENKLFKNKTNAIYGKTMENVEKRMNIKLATRFEKNVKKNGAENYISRPSFKGAKQFTEDLVAIQLSKLYVNYNRPIYVGFSILDISKTVIYEFFYGYLKAMYGDKVTLLYTDTDSLIILVETPNFYQDMQNNLEKFDTSNYETDNIHKISKNISVIGRMKDEFAGRIPSCFLGTGSKAYCIKVEEDVVKKAKGVKKCAIEQQLKVSHYRSIVNGDTPQVTCSMYVFRSDHHTVFTDYLTKVALTSKDDKRFVIPSSTKTLAWGHKDIEKYIVDDDDPLETLIRLMKQTA